MRRFNCLIVEDEPLAAEVLQDYIGQVPFLRLIAICNNAMCALEILQGRKVDLIFLDMHLPKMKGIDFIKTLVRPSNIIITSAYQEYALQGYELNVLDYLLKPVDFNRFLMAVNKLSPLAQIEPVDPRSSIDSQRAYMFFNVSKKKVKVYLDEILYIESLKEYVRIVCSEKTILTKFQLGDMEEMLEKRSFLRIHRSYIVAKNKIEAFSATDVEIGGKQIPIGRSYRELVMVSLEEKNQ